MARPSVSYATPDRISRTRTQPIAVPRTRRAMDIRILTSFQPGKMVPLAAFPLLREDRLGMSRFRLNFEQLETAELLVNAVNVRVLAYLVPWLAFTRFDGVDSLNRSYMKQMAAGASAVVPFFTQQTAGAHGSNAIHKAMGIHERPASNYNAAYVESYNTIWNFRAANRSPDITERTLVDTTLAPAFWAHEQFRYVVPDFDQAAVEGEVPLGFATSKAPVIGLGAMGGGVPQSASANAFFETKGAVPAATPVMVAGEALASRALFVKAQAQPAAISATNLPQIFAELADAGITVSLANIELARKTQAFALLRKQFTGHDDDFIIDLLMQGITVPEQQWRQPILLADRATIFGMSKRYASDSTDLTASVVNGATFIDLSITTPVVPTGGVVMIVAEITPEQLFERQQDCFLSTIDQENLPEFLRDTLDPEKVEIVQNQYVDINHATPSGTFGYAPLNYKWTHMPSRVGGKFFRPLVDAPTDEDRQRIWACETANPVLSRDFYLATSVHQKPFVVTTGDPYECVVRGVLSIEGNTQFGPALIEASDDYAQIMEEAPLGSVKPQAAGTAEEVSDEPADT